MKKNFSETLNNESLISEDIGESFTTPEDVEKELARVEYKNKYRRTLRSTIFMLITSAALAILVATLWLPVLQIYGSSMTPTLKEGQIVVSVKTDNMQSGDVVAFYYGNKVLVKRYIAGPSSWVEIRNDGTIYVNGLKLEEEYIQDKDLGICDLEFPYQVPDDTYFLVGDERVSSVDSRHSSVGCIPKEDIVGKIVYRIWPLDMVGAIK